MQTPPDPSGGAGARDAEIVREVLSAIAVPRLTGSAGWSLTTDWLHDRLTALGFDVTRQTFTFSDWPVRFGLPLTGALIAACIAAAGALLHTAHAVLALLVLVALQAMGALLLLSAERALLRLPWGRREGINLFAGPARPRYVVVAHRDSKSQPLPISIRLLAAAVATLSWLGLALGAGLEAAGVSAAFAPVALAGAGAAAGLVLAVGAVGNTSPGALDNASGVAALIAIAARTRDRTDIAFLVTDAEEFGLAGASATAGGLAFIEGVINLDGLDDAGAVYVLGPHGMRRRGGAPNIQRALIDAAKAMNEELRPRAVPRGLLLDHIAFTRAGVPALTLMRGTLHSMARVHRPADRRDRLRGDGCVLAVALVRSALDALIDGRPVASQADRH